MADRVTRQQKQHDKITIYRPHQRHELGLIESWREMFRNVWESRELIWQLFKRDFTAVYRKSFLGIFWIFLTPLFGIISWVFMQQTGILNPGELDIPYPVYVLIGTAMWGLFVGFYEAAKNTLKSGKEIILQVGYSHEALLFKTTAEQLARFSIAFVMNLVVISVLGVIPHPATILLPVVALPMFLLAASGGLIAAMVTEITTDFSRIDGPVLRLLIFLTPIIYSDQIENEVVRTIIRYNPLTYLVGSARDIVLYGRLYDNTGYAIFSVLAIVLFLIAWRLFYVSESQIVERMI